MAPETPTQYSGWSVRSPLACTASCGLNSNGPYCAAGEEYRKYNPGLNDGCVNRPGRLPARCPPASRIDSDNRSTSGLPAASPNPCRTRAPRTPPPARAATNDASRRPGRGTAALLQLPAPPTPLRMEPLVHCRQRLIRGTQWCRGQRWERDSQRRGRGSQENNNVTLSTSGMLNRKKIVNFWNGQLLEFFSTTQIDSFYF